MSAWDGCSNVVNNNNGGGASINNNNYSGGGGGVSIKCVPALFEARLWGEVFASMFYCQVWEHHCECLAPCILA